MNTELLELLKRFAVLYNLDTTDGIWIRSYNGQQSTVFSKLTVYNYCISTPYRSVTIRSYLSNKDQALRYLIDKKSP